MNRLQPETVQRAKHVDLVSLVGRTVKLVRKGREFWGCCPFHKEKTPSFKVSNERSAYHCFGCGAAGDAIAWLEAVEGLSFVQAVEKLAGISDTAPLHSFTVQKWMPKPFDEADGYREALAIWDAALPAAGTVVEEYLRGRGIRGRISDQLRYAPRLRHSPTKSYFRAMVARLADERGFCAIQRTYLSNDAPIKAPIMPNKMTKAAMRNSAVRLSAIASDNLGLAEGIETALSARMIFHIPVWATLSANRLGEIEIPPDVKTVTLFADAGEVGIEHAFSAAELYEQRGLYAEIITPQAYHEAASASDFNDLVKEPRA